MREKNMLKYGLKLKDNNMGRFGFMTSIDTISGQKNAYLK